MTPRRFILETTIIGLFLVVMVIASAAVPA